jgi:hypothetical protein
VSVDRRSAHAEDSGDLGDGGVPRVEHPLRDMHLRRAKAGRPSTDAATGPRRGQPRPRSLADEFTLELMSFN